MSRRKFIVFSMVLLVYSKVTICMAQENFDGPKYIDQLRRTLLPFSPADILTLLPDFPIDNSTSPSSIKCYEQTSLLVNSTQNGTMWALKMIDASSKIPSGLLMGNSMDLGMYDECMAIREIANGEEIRGRHCMYTISVLMNNMSLQETLSICLPSTCEPKDVVILLNAAFQMISDILPINIPITVQSSTCSVVDAPDWTPGGIATLIGLSLLLLCLVICTISDFYVRNSEINFSPNHPLVWLSQFSLYSNAIRVLSTKKTPQTLPAIQGIRFFSMCWVIFGHDYSKHFMAVMNFLPMFEWVHSWNAMYILIAPFAVDTFFTISGFLLFYLFLKEMSTGRSFNIFSYYIHRYLRLTPALAALLLVTIFILPRVGSGALWDQTMNGVANECEENWWPMLLYIHNYYGKDSRRWCLGHTWYLAVEMHFFWISPLIMYPLAKKRSIGLIILALAFVASVTTPTVISYLNGYSGVVFAGGDVKSSRESSLDFYMASHVRAAPWIIGIFFGYLVFNKQRAPKKIVRWIGWLSTIAALAFCFFSMRVFQAESYVFNTAWETFYVAVSRPLWAGAIGWIIYAAVLGFGGPISTFLSYPIYTPFSRISYCVYLVHFVIQITRLSALRSPQYFSEAACFTEFLTDFALAVIFGFIFTLMFESPIMTLEKIIKGRSQKLQSESTRELGHDAPGKGVDNPTMIRDSSP